MRTFFQVLCAPFKWVWRLLNFIRELVLNFVFIFGVLVIVIAMWDGSSVSNIPESGGALLVNISGIVVDNPTGRDRVKVLSQRLLGSSTNKLQENSLFDIIEKIRQSKDDKKITGMVLDLRNFVGADLAALQDIGKALQGFRTAGKPIFAVSNSYSQGQYYLASFANKIWISPMGEVGLRGFSTNNLYYKSLLNSLKVNTYVFRVGTYKSAVEPFIRDGMSPEARQVASQVIEELWNNYLTTVASNRKLQPGELFPATDALVTALQQAGGDTAQYALTHKLVDKIASTSEMQQQLGKQFGWDKENNSFNAISIYNYPLQSTPQQEKSAGIAVIYINGEIIDGNSAPGYAGSESLAEQIRSVRLDPRIKAVVLRVNSPGGSVTASDVIRNELQELKEAGKPIVVSMGGVAASGGYWVSTPANYIFASANTQTGSIGVFGIAYTLQDSLDAIGIHSDGVATSPLASLGITRDLPPQVQQLQQLSVEHVYQHFIGLVAESRKQTPEHVDSIAQGRVWTGLEAKRKGLVDQIGDFDDAVQKAAQLIKTKQWHLIHYQEEPSYLDMVIENMAGSVRAAVPQILQAYLPAPLNGLVQAVKKQNAQLSVLNDPEQRYILCLECIQPR